jgi:hypothetical protein
MDYSSTFECECFKDPKLKGELTLSPDGIQWREMNLMPNLPSSNFVPRKWQAAYNLIKDVKAHKSLPKLRFELTNPISVPSKPNITQVIDCEFSTLEVRNNCKDLVIKFQKESRIPPEEKRRLRLLAGNIERKRLYDEMVVRRKLIDKEEFWTMQSDLLQENNEMKTRPVGPKNFLDLDAVLDPMQEKWKLTPQIIRQIFIEYPGVKKVYEEKVPTQMTEQQFWIKFKDSYYFHKKRPQLLSSMEMRNRTFDKQAEELFKRCEHYDESKAEEELHHSKIDKFVDLTRNDNIGDGYGIRPDELVAPSKLSDDKLAKHLNLISTRIIKSYMGENNKIYPDQPNISDAIEAEKNKSESRKHTIMDDLINEDVTKTFIPLKIQDKHRYFERLLSDSGSKQISTSNVAIHLSCTQTDMLNAFLEEVAALHSPENANLSNTLIAKELVSTINTEIAGLTSQNDFTSIDYKENPDFLNKLKDIYRVVSEILRHMWSLLNIKPKQWKPIHQAKAENLLASLQQDRETLLSLRGDHQTRQLTNALIENIDAAKDFYSRKFGAQKPIGQHLPSSGTSVTTAAAVTGATVTGANGGSKPSIQTPAPTISATMNRPSISFSLSKPTSGTTLIRKAATTTVPAKQQQPTMHNDEEEEEEDVFTNSNKRVKL